MSPKMKVLVPAIAAGAIAAGGGAAYYFLKVQPAQDVANPLSSFEILPKETIAAGYLSLDENTWSKASKFGTQEARDLILAQFNQIKSSAETNTPSGEPLDFDKDIKPWLGSVTVAGIAEPEGDEPAMIMVIGIKDKLEAIKFATSQKDNAGDDVKISKFEGVDVYEFSSGGSGQFLAVLDNHLVFSDKKSQVESAIKVDQGADSVLSNSEIKTALKESVTVSNPVVVGFANPASFINQIEQAGDTNAFAGNEAVLDDLKKYQAVSMAWGIENQGFRFKNVLKHTLDQEWAFEPLPGKVISRFPDNTLALIHSGNLDKAWDAVTKQLERNPEAKAQFETFRREFSQATQLDLDQDIFSWMDGEFGFGVLPANDGVLAQVGFGGAIAIKTSDQAKASATLDKLNSFAKSSGAQINNKEIDGVSMTQLGIPLQPALVNYGWLDNETLLLSLGESTASTLIGTPNPSVKQNAIFKSLTGSLPNQDKGLFYINAEEMLATARSSPTIASALSTSPDVDAVLSSFQGLIMTGAQPDKNTAIGEALLTFRQE